MSDMIARMGIIGELMRFLWSRKLYWLIPMIVTLLVFAVIIILGSNSGIGIFLYPLF